MAKKPDFHTFLRTPWRTIPRECGPSEYANPIDLWNVKTSSYKLLSNYGRHLHIRYEDLLFDPEGTIDIIAASFGMKRNGATFKDIKKSTKHANLSSLDYKDYYLDKHWLKKLNSDDIVFINSQIDKILIKEIGYETIPPL